MENKKVEELVKRYEELQADNKVPYLDANDYLDIANYYWVKKRDEEALKSISDALQIHPDNEEIIKTQIELYIDTDNLVKAREIMNSTNCRVSASIRCLDAELYYEEGDTDSALIILNELYDINTDADVFADMAELYNEMDDKEAAVRCLKLAVKMSPENMDYVVPLATTLCELGNYKKAIKYLNQIIDSDPYSFLAWMKIGECYLALEKFDKATEAAEFALIASPESEAPFFIRSQAYFHLGNYEKALEDIYKISTFDGTPICFLSYFKGLCYIQLENFIKAEELLKQALAEMEETGETEDITYFQLLLYLFKCLNELKKYEEALLLMTKLPMDKSDVQIVTNLFKSNSSAEENEDPGDIDSLLQIVAEGGTAENWYNLAIAYLEKKRFADAIGAFLLVMDMEPKMKGLGLNLVLAFIGNNETDEIRKNIEFIKQNLKESHPGLQMDLSEDKIEELINLITDMFSDFLNSTPE